MFHPPDPAHSRRLEELRVIVALWLLMFASTSQALIVAPILPRIGEALAIPEELRGTLVTAHAIAQMVFALLTGPISDRVGRRPVLLAGSGSMLVFLLLHSLAHGYAWLLVVRALTGVSGGLLTGVAVSYIGDYFPYERRGWAAGWVMTGFAFGQILALPAGTILASSHGFRAPFLLFAAPMASSFLLVLLGFPRPASAAVQEVGGTRDVLRLYSAMLGTRVVVAAALTMGLMFFAQSSFFVYLPTWLERERGAAAGDVATMFMVGGIASVVAGPRVGRLSDRLGRKPLILASCLGMAALMPAFPYLIREVWTAFVVVFVVMVLISMRISPMQALLTALTPASTRGTLLSLTIACGHLGTGVGGGLAGLLFVDHGYGANTIMTSAAMMLAAIIVGFALPEPGERREQPTHTLG
jgi:predicted MFS family arabinose efflux permease